jgi:hypothetical protein
MVVEPWAEKTPRTAADREQLLTELRELATTNQLTRPIQHFLLHPGLPVDVRHNAKINRELLAAWATKHVASG